MSLAGEWISITIFNLFHRMIDLDSLSWLVFYTKHYNIRWCDPWTKISHKNIFPFSTYVQNVSCMTSYLCKSQGWRNIAELAFSQLANILSFIPYIHWNHPWPPRYHLSHLEPYSNAIFFVLDIRLIYMSNFRVWLCNKVVHFCVWKFIVCVVNLQA
jgi:hypothetical protein